jgi:small subunit ribosomal protein S16
MGKIRNPQYRIVIADSRTKRDGKAIEFIGIYHPKEDPSVIEVKSDRVQHWLSVGAQPSEAVQRLLELTGDWQKFKGLPAPEPLKMAPERTSRTVRYEAEAKAAAGLVEAEKPAKKAAKKAEKPAARAAAPAKAEAPAQAEAPAKTTEPAKAEAPAQAEAPAAVEAAAQTEEQAGADSGERA